MLFALQADIQQQQRLEEVHQLLLKKENLKLELEEAKALLRGRTSRSSHDCELLSYFTSTNIDTLS